MHREITAFLQHVQGISASDNNNLYRLLSLLRSDLFYNNKKQTNKKKKFFLLINIIMTILSLDKLKVIAKKGGIKDYEK